MRKTFCLVLKHVVALAATLGFLDVAMAATPRQVVCQGPIRAQQMNRKVVDRGNARVQFQISERSTIQNIYVSTRFARMSAQALEAYEAKAVRRAIASGRYRADLFNIGHNGACQMALAYQGEMAQAAKNRSSWGVLMMGCGSYGVQANLKCQIK